MEERTKIKLQLWGVAVVIGLILAWLGNIFSVEEKVLQTITVNAPQAMHEAFEATLKELELDEEYEIKFTSSKDANFVVTNQKNDSNELIAYSPVIAVFKEDDAQDNTYLKEGIFVKSETEPEQHDFDLKKVMIDIIENPDSVYKVYYPDESMCNWSVFYAFLLYTANDGYYPSDGTNMVETKQVVDAFLESKNTESITLEGLDKIGGYAKNSIYLMPLADLGYIYENNHIACRVMYPKTVVYSNYYASFDETGKILYDALEKDSKEGLFSEGRKYVGYYYLRSYGNYFVKKYTNEVSIGYNSGRSNIYLNLRTTFNAVDVPEELYFSKQEEGK